MDGWISKQRQPLSSQALSYIVRRNPLLVPFVLDIIFIPGTIPGQFPDNFNAWSRSQRQARLSALSL